MRKHKKWDDDGTLEVTGKHAILKVMYLNKLYIYLIIENIKKSYIFAIQNTEGNIIHKTIVNPEVLTEGFRMYIDNKEIEVKIIETYKLITCL